LGLSEASQQLTDNILNVSNPAIRRKNHGTKRAETSEERQKGSSKDPEGKARRQASQEEPLVVEEVLEGPGGIEPGTCLIPDG
jgi:hypothetical protein